GTPIADLIKNNPDYSLYYKLIEKGGMETLLNNKSAVYTSFVPDNNGMKQFISLASGGLVPLNAPDAVFDGFISANLDTATCFAIVSYYTLPQKLDAEKILEAFPNVQYPSIFNPLPSVSALLRLTTFPS